MTGREAGSVTRKMVRIRHSSQRFLPPARPENKMAVNTCVRDARKEAAFQAFEAEFVRNG